MRQRIYHVRSLDDSGLTYCKRLITEKSVIYNVSDLHDGNIQPWFRMCLHCRKRLERLMLMPRDMYLTSTPIDPSTPVTDPSNTTYTEVESNTAHIHTVFDEFDTFDGDDDEHGEWLSRLGVTN